MALAVILAAFALTSPGFNGITLVSVVLAILSIVRATVEATRSREARRIEEDR